MYLYKSKYDLKVSFANITFFILGILLFTSTKSFSSVTCESLFSIKSEIQNEIIVHGVAGRVYRLSEMYRMNHKKGKLKMYRGVSMDPRASEFNLNHTSSDGVIWFSPNKDYAIQYAVGQYQVRKNKRDQDRLSLLFEYEVPYSDIYWTHKEAEMKEVTLKDLKENEYEAITPALSDPKKFLIKVYILDSRGHIVGELLYDR